MAVAVLVIAAGLNGATPDGWRYDYALGHAFCFYIFANAPMVGAILIAPPLWLWCQSQNEMDMSGTKRGRLA